MKELNLKQSLYDPALFYAVDSKGAFIGAVGTHVDDFLVVGEPEMLQYVRKSLEAQYEIKHKMLGPPGEGEQRVSFLGRQISWRPEGIGYEADHR